MKIDGYFDEFIKGIKYDNDLKKTAKKLLNTKNNKASFALTSMDEFDDSDCFADNVRDSVKRAPRGKAAAIKVYERLASFLRDKGVDITVKFPPIPIENSFERQMFIAKYLQSKDAKIKDLEDILWVSDRTIEEDLRRLRGEQDPIQICGRPFTIKETNRSSGRLHFASTVHPLFLTENLTQVIVMLKGLRKMAEDPMYTQYAVASAADIWIQLSEYAKKRIHFVLSELLPEDLNWYENLENKNDSFYSERQCSVRGNVWLDCMKNEKPFCVEYMTDDGIEFYEGCCFLPKAALEKEKNGGYAVMTNKGKRVLQKERIIRSAYSVEELAAD